MLFSVIIPFEYHRGVWRHCLAAWTAQRFDAGAFELILVVPPGFSDDDRREARNALRAHDRIVDSESEHDMGLSAVGARHAQARYLFFTESHCWPDADALDICRRTFDEHPEWAGFSCRSLRVADTAFAQAEADMYEGDIAHGMSEHPWLKVLDQCFATRREAYEACGGLRPELGHFAEWALAASYHVRNLQIGFQPEAKFHHQYVGETGELITFTRDFVAGEIAYLNGAHDERIRKILDVPYEWRCQGNWDASAWLALARVALAGGLSRSGGNDPFRSRRTIASMYAKRALRMALDAPLIAPLEELGARLKFYLALYTADRKSHSAAFRTYIAACIRAHRLRLVKTQPAPRSELAFDVMAAGNTGLYPNEAFDGGETRWTETYALLRGHLDAGSHWIDIKCAALRSPKDTDFAIFFNAQRVPDAGVTIDGSSIRFAATQPRSGACSLILVCADPRIAADGRPLGLPLQAIETSSV